MSSSNDLQPLCYSVKIAEQFNLDEVDSDYYTRDTGEESRINDYTYRVTCEIYRYKKVYITTVHMNSPGLDIDKTTFYINIYEKEHITIEDMNIFINDLKSVRTLDSDISFSLDGSALDKEHVEQFKKIETKFNLIHWSFKGKMKNTEYMKHLGYRIDNATKKEDIMETDPICPHSKRKMKQRLKKK